MIHLSQTSVNSKCLDYYNVHLTRCLRYYRTRSNPHCIWSTCSSLCSEAGVRSNKTPCCAHPTTTSISHESHMTDTDGPWECGLICITLRLCPWFSLTLQSSQQVLPADICLSDYEAIRLSHYVDVCFHLLVIYPHSSNHRKGLNETEGGVHMTDGGSAISITLLIQRIHLPK